MSLIKRAWKKEQKLKIIGVEILDRIAARGSFVVVKGFTCPREEIEKKPVKAEETLSETQKLSELINERVRDVNLKLWIENLAENLPVIKRSKSIDKLPRKENKAVIIVGAGPSFKRNNHMELLKKAAGKIVIIATDRMFIPLLNEGIIPDIVVSLDGDRQRIVKWYDSKLVDDSVTVGAMAVTVAPNVLEQFKGKKFFFTPLIDEPSQPISLSKAISYMTNTPIISSGGNVGITCVNLSWYLNYKIIILTGLDLGYPIDTPIEESAYYPVVKEADPQMAPEKFKKLFLIYGYNPDFKVRYYTDIVYKYHRDYLVELSRLMAEDKVTLINATEGGSVHGGRIIGMPLKEAISKYAH